MTSEQPKRWKLSLLTWLCIYPLINILFVVLMPHIQSWHPMLRTLLLTVILVPLMGLLVGKLQQRFSHWLRQ